MRFKQSSFTWILVLLAQTGVLYSTWGVNYQQRRICAVRGSSVVIPCSFNPPGNQRVRRALWFQFKPNSHKVPIVYVNNAKTKSRFHYIGDKYHNCSLKIFQLQLKDAGKYAFRFVTNAKGGKFFSRNGSTLKIVDLQVLLATNQRGDGTVKEGDSLSLTCKNACDGARVSSSFTWFKNGRHIKEGPVHHLTNVSSTDSGNYTCSLSAHTGTTSRVLNINVEYGPKNTSVSVRRSVEADVSSNITLTCSSQANPPVERYVWFEVNEDHVVELKGGSVLVTDVEGQFLCSASNKHGSQNSSVVLVKYKESKCWATFTTRDILIIAGAAVLLIGTAVICIWRLSRKRKWKLETDCGGNLQNEDSVNWLGCETNRPQDGNHSEAGAAELVYVTLEFNHRRRLNRKQPIGSHANTGVIYSTVCRNIQHPLRMQSSTSECHYPDSN